MIMHKIFISLLVAAFVFSLVSIGAVKAEEKNDSPNPPAWCQRFKGAFNQGRGNRPEISEEEIAVRKQRRLNHGAEMLGISPEELKTKLESGMKMPEIARELGVNPEDFPKKVRRQSAERIRNHFQQMVKEGKMTQEQANKRIGQAEKQAEKMKNRRPNRGFGPFTPRPNQGQGR